MNVVTETSADFIEMKGYCLPLFGSKYMINDNGMKMYDPAQSKTKQTILLSETTEDNIQLRKDDISFRPVTTRDPAVGIHNKVKLFHPQLASVDGVTISRLDMNEDSRNQGAPHPYLIGNDGSDNPNYLEKSTNSNIVRRVVSVGGCGRKKGSNVYSRARATGRAFNDDFKLFVPSTLPEGSNVDYLRVHCEGSDHPDEYTKLKGFLKKPGDTHNSTKVRKIVK